MRNHVAAFYDWKWGRKYQHEKKNICSSINNNGIVGWMQFQYIHV